MIKKNDNVIVIAGKEKGKTGAVSRIFPKSGLVIIAGVNLQKKHQRPRRGGEKGQIIDKAMPIHISNVMLLEGGKRVRTGRKLVGERYVRVSKKTGKEI